jgi:membrane-bound metal-dependent hydrolase YbcI (DUF457 family)
MPEHKTHLFVGFLVYVTVLYLVLFFGPISWERKIELLMYTLIGALFPDIDTKSKIQRVMYSIFFFLLVLLAYTKQYVAATATGILACLPLMVHHRGIFHSIIFLTCLAASAVFCTHLYYPLYTTVMVYNAIFFLAGVFSHLFADKKFS